MNEQEERYKNLNDFFNKHSGILTVLSIFFVFISISGKNFLPEIGPGVNLSIISEFLWFFVMLIIIICLIVLIKESFWIKKSSLSIKFLGVLLFFATILIIIYFLLASLSSANIPTLFFFSPKKILIALLVIFSPIIFTLINKIKVRWLFWILYLIIPLLSLFFLLKDGVQNWSNQLATLNIFYWFISAIFLSFCVTVSYKISDWRNKK